MTLFATLRSAALSSLALSDAVRISSQNIANADNPNYHRHELDFSTTDLNTLRIARVRRVTEQGLERRYTQQISQASYRTTLQRYSEELKIETGLGSVGSSSGDAEAPVLDTALQRFETALRSLQAAPHSASNFNEFVASGRDLTQQIRQSAGSLQRFRYRLDDRIEQQTTELNGLVERLRDLNALVTRSRNTGTAEGVVNQRDEVLRNIAERISVQVLEDGNGAKSLYLQNGRALIVGGVTNELLYDRGTKQFALNVESDLVATDERNQLGAGSLTALFDLVRESPPSRESTDEDVALIAKYEDQLESLARILVADSTGDTPPTNLDTVTINDALHLARIARSGIDTIARSDLFVGVNASPNNPFRFAIDFSPALVDGDPALTDDVLDSLASSTPSQNILQAFQLEERNIPPPPSFNIALPDVILPPALQQQNQNYYGLVQGISIRLNDVAVAYQDNATQQQGVRNNLQNLLSNFVGVNIDEEFLKISQLQQTFSANARVIRSVQEMLAELLASV